ncbi:DUF1707 SHOCT-like domain-containing protein [Actinoalloteichus hymeniacidonis]|uniref:DUF1707 family protein n=1 Tax=Actinoalloteichus hymeniacidonis TaxID=340345 RepID=A0AAC9N120_9PSEU|nr:DUF1707 domain-containing protein [Actinoalloteichus hymeniacidonis]AOS65672.1 putative DUF1707 family protein [Actinoalloteichus hymeniacidonis]MBB5906238.1 hypothetical protein [Actinoalloteichus hymeniacidonis]
MAASAGDEIVPTDPVPIRASDAERETYAARIQQAFAEGRLDMAELDARLTGVYAATTLTELASLVRDLPQPNSPTTSQHLATGAAVEAPEELVLKANASGIERKGEWVVPRRLVAESKVGWVKLDFSSALIQHREISVELNTKYGMAELVLPEGATADVDGLEAKYGQVSLRVPTSRSAGTLHVSVSGNSKYGSVTIRYKRWYG